MTNAEIALFDAGGRGLDYVAFRQQPSGGAGPNQPADTAWSGTLSTLGDSVRRSSRTDSDSAGDFTVDDSPGTPGTLNPGQ